MAELKQPPSELRNHRTRCFHGVTTVAELKRFGRGGNGSSPRFPRRHNRGRIEAVANWRNIDPDSSFPRRHNRGRIEAGGPRPMPNNFSRFHGVTTVAELKRLQRPGTGLLRRGFHGVTTVAELKRSGRFARTLLSLFPRRHNRGRIEAALAASPDRSRLAFPRRHNRGRIEAFPTPSRRRRALRVSTASQPWPN